MVQGHVSLGYTSVAKAGHVRGINLQVKKEEEIVHEREIKQAPFERSRKIIFTFEMSKCWRDFFSLAKIISFRLNEF